MKHCTKNFLEMQGYKIIGERINSKQEMIFRLEKIDKKNCCPACKSKKLSIHQYGEWRLKKHSNFQEKLIYVEVMRNRLICLKCKFVFSEDMPDIKKRERKTVNFVKQSLNYLSKNSFREVSKVNQISYSPLKKQLYKYVDPFQLVDYKIEQLAKMSKIYLGLDGQSFRGQDMVLTITEVKQKQLLTILPSEYQADLLNFIEKLPVNVRNRVKGIAMDMTNKHKSLLSACFTNALIVVDHYHVVQNAIHHLQKIRTLLQSARRVSIPIKKELEKNYEDLTDQEKLKVLKYFIMFPQLREAYWIKEKIRSLYRISNYRKAVQKFKIIKKNLLASKEMELREFGNTLKNWEDEILNYFKCPITNGYTEGLHTKCKLIKRKSFGFRNVQTYIRKLILGIIPIVSILEIYEIFTHFSS